MKAAESFLNFEGDFSAEVSAEDSKIPLNSFYALTPTQPDYDRLKNILIYLMRQKPFEPLLKDKIRDSQELATKIVDYIDRNEAINEMGGSERGAENSQYAGSKNKPKNAKLISIEELILVPGMTDDLLSELKKHVTVYKTDTKINACQATPELVRAMIIAYTQNRTDMEPLRIDSEDRIKNAVNAVLGKCPDINAMSQALNESLGVTASSASSAGPTPSSQPATGAGAGSISSSFATMLTADENIYRIESTGTVGNAEVKLIDVLNTGGGNPDNWKDLYWRVE
ncbi:MAG: general secretion pathway protein GspK [Deltaproteobacteria bacterium]|nr:general secretion pathway protein GspK [Deltaproteobacteria bacterium]